jgi:predicted enzyme related to lactoylglutathione lyase
MALVDNHGKTAAMTSIIQNICFDCAAPYPLAEFWSQVLGIPVDEDCEPGDDEVGFLLRPGQYFLCLKVPEPKVVKNRVHLCLEPQQVRDTEVDRLLGIGATMVDDRRKADGLGWAVLADPEGNEFCVLRSAEERAENPVS